MKLLLHVAVAYVVLSVACGRGEAWRSQPLCGVDAAVSTGGARSGGAPGTGGRVATGGASGGSSSGGASSGGASSGGASSGGAPGTGGATGGSSTGGVVATGGATGGGGAAGGAVGTILWRDSLQVTSGAPFQWGFDELLVERPGDTEIVGSDAVGANLTRVVDPLGGAGYALRHLCTFDQTGCRSEAGLWSFQNAVFGTQAKRPEGVWVAQEWYFPQALTAGNDDVPWVNVWDWHSTDNVAGRNRWHTSPGLMLHEDGSMRVRWEWGAGAEPLNPVSAWSSSPLPVGRWFDVEMHYAWATSGAKLELWVDGQLVLTQSNAVTKRSSHTVVEMYSKWYGAQNDGSRPWAPSPALRYTRNVRVGNGRIWPQK